VSVVALGTIGAIDGRAVVCAAQFELTEHLVCDDDAP